MKVYSLLEPRASDSKLTKTKAPVLDKLSHHRELVFDIRLLWALEHKVISELGDILGINATFLLRHRSCVHVLVHTHRQDPTV